MIKLVVDADTDRLHGASILADSKVIQTAVPAIRQGITTPELAATPPPLPDHGRGPQVSDRIHVASDTSSW